MPPGSIIPWFGRLRDLPEGWHVCDGTNGTPDLRDRFIVGAGRNYNLEDVGGADEVTLEANEQPSHYHFFGWNSSDNTGYFLHSVMRDTGLHLLMEYMRKNGMVAMVVIGLNPGLEKI